MDGRPSPEIAARVERLLGWAPESWRPVHGGYTPAARFAVASGKRSGFVKIATIGITAKQINREIEAYSGISGRFVPELLGAEAHETTPILIIEDLSAATWPPPWSDSVLDQVLKAIADMHRAPSTLRHGTLLDNRDAGWPSVAADPRPFLSLGLATPQWLHRALPMLLAAEASCALEGEALTHLDLRSDNLCITASGVKLIDWAEACRSNPLVDLGFFLPSLTFEGGPRPEAILPDAPAIAATVAGFFAARAGLPDIPEAPYVRRVQRQQLTTALPWAARALGLPEPC